MTRTNASRHSSSPRPGSAFLAATKPLGRAALSCGLAGALSLGAAGAALANGHDGSAPGRADQNRAAGQNSAAADKKSAADEKSAAAPSASEEHRRNAASEGAPSRRSAAATKTGRSERAASTHQPKASGSRASAPQRAHDPAGNNGTIKVDGPAWDARVDNEPHTSCAFRVTFFGFDEGQTADITVTGVAPTGGGVLLHDTAVPTSDDAAGGAAHDFDGATRVYTADDLGLDAVTPHPQQGYHLKIAVDSLEAPGGAKQKVLWLEPCETEVPVTQPEVGGFEEGGTPPTGSTPGELPKTDQARPGSPAPQAAATSELPQGTVVAAPAAVRAEAAAYLEVPDASGAAAAQASPASAASTAQASALPTSLAFTGAAGLELLALTGAAAAAAGAGLLTVRRRVSTQAR